MGEWVENKLMPNIEYDGFFPQEHLLCMLPLSDKEDWRPLGEKKGPIATDRRSFMLENLIFKID